jgi:hypothetical protein
MRPGEEEGKGKGKGKGKGSGGEYMDMDMDIDIDPAEEPSPYQRTNHCVVNWFVYCGCVIGWDRIGFTSRQQAVG